MDVEAPVPAESGATDQMAKVMAALEALRADYREIVLLRYFEGMSYEQIAETLGMTVGAVGEKLSRVRDMIVERCRL